MATQTLKKMRTSALVRVPAATRMKNGKTNDIGQTRTKENKIERKKKANILIAKM